MYVYRTISGVPDDPDQIARTPHWLLKYVARWEELEAHHYAGRLVFVYSVPANAIVAIGTIVVAHAFTFTYHEEAADKLTAFFGTPFDVDHPILRRAPGCGSGLAFRLADVRRTWAPHPEHVRVPGSWAYRSDDGMDPWMMEALASAR